MSSRQQRRKLQRKRTSARTLQVGAGALALTLVPAAVAQASTIKVTNLKDSGSGSLRAAITAADSIPQAGTELILFSSRLTGSIDLQTPLPAITRSIELHAPGAREVTINGKSVPTDSGSLLDDTGAGTSLTVSGLSFTDSTQKSGSFITVNAAGAKSLKLVGDSFTGGKATDGDGGAVFSYDTNAVTVDDCTFAHNSAEEGGGLWVGGSVDIKIEDSTLVDNVAQDGGGGFGSYNGGALTFTATTISGNAVSFSGTGTTAGYGGGIEIYGEGRLALRNTIVAGNTASGNQSHTYRTHYRDVFLFGKHATMSASFSLIQHDTTGLTGLNATDILGKSPDLGPLRDNGGATDTELPKGKSPVINAGRAFGLKTDQRGLKRTVEFPGVKKRKGSDGTDIGAVELQGLHRKKK
jgi:hypothetical protein